MTFQESPRSRQEEHRPPLPGLPGDATASPAGARYRDPAGKGTGSRLHPELPGTPEGPPGHGHDLPAPGGVHGEPALFGRTFRLPVFAAPIGAVGLHYNDPVHRRHLLRRRGPAPAPRKGPRPSPATTAPGSRLLRAPGGDPRGRRASAFPTIKPWGRPGGRSNGPRRPRTREPSPWPWTSTPPACTVLAAMGKPVSPDARGSDLPDRGQPEGAASS
ncbi:MAG: hypothetical protein M0C28_30525 [Candidatus Moduliflexus flocculans]|nr:hypothetical protein [Candidatus Moduliflexus flocculans]